MEHVKVELTSLKPDMPHFQRGACIILEMGGGFRGSQLPEMCVRHDSPDVPRDHVICSQKINSDGVLRPGGADRKGWWLRGISGMTFSIPLEERCCNYSNQNIVWDKEPGNLPVILHAT